MDFKSFIKSKRIRLAFLSVFLLGMAPPPPLVGGPAPNFELETVDGQVTRLSNFKGRFVILNFWATWCAPCIKEMPELQKAHRHFKEKGIEIVAINFAESKASVNKFAENNRLSFPILLDRFGSTSEKYKVLNLPVTYFITPDGIIRDKIYGGGITEDMIQTKIKQLKAKGPFDGTKAS